jgi:hypothetical protein
MRLERWNGFGSAVWLILGTCLVVLAPSAVAGPVANFSRTFVGFSFVPPLAHIVQAVFVTNTGDAPLNVSAISLTGANSTEFILGGTCAAPIALAAGGGRCRIDIATNLAISGSLSRAATLTVQSDASPATATIGVSATADTEAPYVSLLSPSWIDFPRQAVGTPAPQQTFTFTNPFTDPLTATLMLENVFAYLGDSTDFPVTTDCATVGVGASCTITIGFHPTATGPRSTELEIDYRASSDSLTTVRRRRYSVTGVGTNGNPATVNYQGLWWNSPAGSEAGWGINFAHQGEIIFASWFTYDLTGKGLWLVMTAPNIGGNSFSGTLLQATGPAFDAMPFPPQGSPGGITGSSVGTGTLTFGDANSGSFAYTVNGITQTKAITRQVFGTLPTCTFSPQNNLAAASNYQDLWWAAPAASEAGWGINLTHQGDTIFATWFTFDHDHTPMWLVVTAAKSGPGSYAGNLLRTTGPPFNSVPFPPIGSPGSVVSSVVGTATFTFTDGNTVTFAYTVNGVSQTKAVMRQVFRPPGTVCQ